MITELNTATAGFLVHRVGQLRYEYHREGMDFAAELVDLINAKQQDYVTVLLFEEMFGAVGRPHWIVHLKQPNDYARLLDMVDHDARWREIADMDRLPAKGGGTWEKLFIESSITETIMCPQHGLGHYDDRDTFQPAARFQTTIGYSQLLHSGNAGLIVHRSGQAKYAVREEARLFWYEWGSLINDRMPGDATVFLYEEMWGRQDRLHLLIHLASADAYTELNRLAAEDEAMRDLLARQWVPTFKGGGGWERLFTDGSIGETVLTPRHKAVAR